MTVQPPFDQGDSDSRRAALDLVAEYEAAQQRVARALHDRVGQSLGSVLLNLELGGDAPLEASLRDELLDELRGALALLRDVTLDLRPALLDEVGLGEALRALVRRAVERAGRPVELTLPDSPLSLPPDVALVAYRLMQAVLAEAMPGGRLGDLRLAIDMRPGDLRLELQGDGVGKLDTTWIRRRVGLFGGQVARLHDEAGLTIRLPFA